MEFLLKDYRRKVVYPYEELQVYPDGYVKQSCIKCDPEGNYLEVPYCSYSNFSGCTVEVSNYRTFIELFGSFLGVYEVRGDHGTRAILVEYDKVFGKIYEEILGLFSFPVIDESDLCELQDELYNEEVDRIAQELDGYDVWTEELIKSALNRALSDGLIEEVFDTNSCSFLGLHKFLSEKLHIDTNV